jgi:hypothetical protein
MTQNIIDIGVQGNDGTGDSIRESFRKVNENFNEIYAVFGLGGTVRFTDLGDTPNSYTSNQVIMSDTTGTSITARDIIAGAGISINKSNNSSLTISSTTTGLIGDTAPSLGLNLNANNFTIARLANPSQALVDSFNASYASLGVSTTLAQLAINKGYADSHYVANVNGYIVDALRSRPQPAVPQINDPDYDKTLTSNYVSTEVMQRKDAVYRGGDTMTGALTLSDHPSPLVGFGTPNSSSDLQAATKYYVDNSTYSSNVNLFVSNASGDDSQTRSPVGKEGRFWQYAYKTVGQAALAAENLINLASLEAGPYKQKIAYTVGVNQTFSTIQSVTLTGGNAGVSGYEHASQLLSLNKTFIQSETIAYLNKKYVNYIPIDNARYTSIIGKIVDGIGYDLVLGTNYNSVTQASKLFNPLYVDLVTEQLTQLLDGIDYAKNIILSYSYNTVNAQNYISAVVDALCYDLAFQGSYQSIQVALAFNQYNTGLDLNEITATLLNLGSSITAISTVALSTNAVASFNNNITLINNLLTTGVIPTVTFPGLQTTALGLKSARDLLLNNIPFIQAEITAYLKANFPTVIYNSSKSQRDIQYIVWSLVYDLMYGGNQQSIYASLQYWQGGVYQLLASEKEACVSAIGYINNLAQSIIINAAPAIVYQTSFRQYTNETIIGGSAASVSISTNVASIVSIVNAISLPAPLIVTPTTSSVSSVLLTARTDVLAQKVALKTAATTYINANTSFSVINNNVINGIITTNFNTISNILTVGINSRPIPTYVSPSGLSTRYTYARQALLANKDFLVEETYAWQLIQTPTFVPTEGVDSFKRRLGYFIEAVAYDITYGGNSGSLPGAYEYWVASVSTLTTIEKAIYVQALSRLQNLATLASANSIVTPTFQGSVTQVFNSLWADPVGGSAANADINERFLNISNIVDNNTTLVYVYPDLAVYDSVYKAARLTIIGNRSAIATSVVTYVTAKYKGGFNYNETTCYRDIGYIIEGMRIDLLTGGNFQTVTAGKSYYKSASARLAITTQLTETVDGITFAKNLALQVLNQTSATRFQTLITQVLNGSLTASTPAKTTFTTNMNTILSIIANGYGSAPASSFGTGIYTVVFSNGGNGYVDQGSPGSVHIIPAKILSGSTSGAAGTIVKYLPGSGSGTDSIQVRLTKPAFFQNSEEMEFGETVKELNITIFVESGIYKEDYPIRLPANCSIKGDEFRRTIIRPLDRISQSPWRKIFFYRDAVIDGLQIGQINSTVDYAPATSASLSGTTDKIIITLGSGQAQASWIGKIIRDNNNPAGKAVVETVAGNTLNCSVIYPFAAKTTYASGNWHIYGTYNYGRHYLVDPLDINSTAKNNKDIDVMLCGDATRISNITFQGHGGFAMVLDPEGQIKTKSPYGQVCTSFSQSINRQAFRGGQFVDGFAGRLFGTITNVADSGITVTVTGSVNSGLDIRPPQVPCVFYVQGNRFQVNDIVSYDPNTYTVVMTLDVSTPFNTLNIYNTTSFSTAVGLRIDDLTNDLVLGSNFQSAKTGLFYLQNANVVVGIKQTYLLNGLNKATSLINATISNGTSKGIITSQMATITDMISSGLAALPVITFPEPAGVTSNVVKAKNILIANKQFIRDELVAWVAQTFATRGYPGYNAFVLSARMGYLIDAMTYDLLYGGNSGTRDIAEFYYSDSVSQISGLEYLYASTISKLISIVRSIIINTVVTPTIGNISVQVTNLSAATTTEGTTLANLASLAIDYIIEGNYNNSIIGTITNGSTTITNVSYNPALVASATIASAVNAGIPLGTTIVSYTQATNTLVISAPATVNSTNLKLIIGGSVPSRVSPTVTGQNSQRMADRVTIVAAKTSIQNAVTSYLDAGGGVGINIEMGGNRSMLANDFAMINDLGYAIVATNGGVTEQVSTFTYYCHTHYWANNGGQIRSVAGSNAHGNYALRSSGYDVTELPDSVKLANDMVQTAQVYKQGLVVSQMTPTVSAQALAIWMIGYTYAPPNNSELEIDHTAQGGAIYRYLISTVEHTTITVNGQNVLKLNLSTAGTNSTITTGLAYALYDGQVITLRVNQNIKFNNIDNVKPTRPSTAVQYSENLGDIYRIIAYNLVESTGELLGNNIAILQSDSTFNYYKFTTDTNSLTQLDPGNAAKTQGSKVGDNKLAILQISQQSQIDQINKGIFLLGWNGRVHRVISYTPPLFIATGAFSSYNAGILTLVVINVSGSIDIGDIITGTGFTSGQTVSNVVLSGTGTITATVTLSAVADTTPAGTITFGVSKNGYLSMDPNSVLNNSADGTGVAAMNYVSKAAGPTGTTYTQVTYDVPFTGSALPVVDSYLTIANQANTSYNGTYQILTVTSKTQISVASTSLLSVGMVISSSGTDVYIPSTCVIQSIDSATSFTVSPAAWIPAGTSIVSTLVAYLSGVTISNPGTNYTVTPQITVSGGGPLVQAIVTCTVANGSIQSVTVVSPGYGYSSTPNITVSYGDAGLTPVLSESPQVNSTVSAGDVTNRLGLIYASDPGAFTLGSGITVSSFVSKTGTGPWIVTLTIPTQGSAPTAGTWFQVTGNTNTLYNGFYKVNTTGSNTTTIALIYNNNPGSWSSSTTTTIKLSVTNGTSSQLGIGKPFSTSTAVTLRAGYPADSAAQVTTRISTCRVTGHDLLDIGTGSYTTTNWPTVIYGNPAKVYQQSQEIKEEGVGRVFYVTTDQNGIFRVGRFFTVDQGTGSVTFSASIALSNLDGLGFKRGVVVSEFSTDPSMTNNASDTVPVMSAIRSYIDKRLGIDHGGSPVALANLIGSGYMPLNGTLAMKATLNLGNFNIVNLGTPGSNYEAANKLYVDNSVIAYNALNKMTDVTITSASTNNTLVYDGVANKWKNATMIGDINLSYNTSTGVLTASIQAGVIANSQVSATAGIVQSKLSLAIASTAASAPVGSAAVIQAANGVVSFNSNEFTVSNGWASLKTSNSSSTGVTLGKIQQISAGTILGNRTGAAASPAELTPAQVISDAGGLTGTLFGASGVMTVAYDGSNIGNNQYSVTGVTTSRAINSLVKTDGVGGIDVNYVKIGGYKALGITSLTNTFTTPGGFDYMTVLGTTSSNSNMTVFGTLDVSNGTLKTNLLTTDKSGASSGPNAGSASINGWWSVQASSQIDFSLGTLKSLTLTTGADNINGTMVGRWSLSGASRLQATYADLAEYYEGDQDYEEGTVLVFGGDKEVTTTTQMNDTRSAGVVSANPAYVMNGEQTGIKVCIALAGRVPVKVIGRVKKGDMLTTSATAGYAVKALNPTLGAVIGKALEDKDYGEAGMIQVAVGRV